MADSHTKALLGTKPGSMKRLKQIAVEMKNILAELKKAKGLKEDHKERRRLFRRAVYLTWDLGAYANVPKRTFPSKVPRSTVRLYHALFRAMDAAL